MHDIMTLEEVAAYLRVSERTAYDWAQKGELPGGKLGTTWRFKREDIEQWVNAHISKPKPISALPGSMDLSRVLTPERIIRLDAPTKEEVLTKLVDLLADTPYVSSRDKLYQSIFAREELMSTGIGFGVGVPHVRIDSVKELVMAVAVCARAVSGYTSLDNIPVQIVCMVAARPDQHAQYIRTLARISSLLKDEQTRERIIEAHDAEAVYKHLISNGQ